MLYMLELGIFMDEINLAVRYFSQRENKYKWQNSNDSKDTFYIGPVSCNITSLCMIMNFLGITDDTPYKMSEKIFNYYNEWNSGKGYEKLESWSNIKSIITKIYDIPEQYVKSLENKNIDVSIEKYLKNGYPIIFSIGTLAKKGEKTTGHIIVLRGKKNKSYFIINDPWGDPTNAFAQLVNISGKMRGFYEPRIILNEYLYGKGSGDNCILSYEAFYEATGQNSESGKIFNGALTITYPYIYSCQPGNIKYGLEEKTKEKIYLTYKNNIRYLLSDNGRITNALELHGQNGKEIHSIASGRVIAIRNTQNINDNFILIQYKIPEKNNSFFYVRYKRLQYVDIEEEIKNKLFSCDTYSNDLISQLILKIHAKKGIYDKGDITGSKHPDFMIPERGFIYFFPTEKKLKDYILNIHNMDNLLYEVNDINNYKRENKYNIFIDTEERTIETKNIIPLSINYREYIYYREKIKSIADGEITTFCDEDYKKTIKEIELVNKNNFEKYYIEAVKNCFPEVTFNNPSYDNALQDVEKYYKELAEKTEKNTDLKKYWNEFELNCKTLCKELLEMPWETQEWAFTLNDRWYKGGDKKDANGKTIGKFSSLHDIYINIQIIYNTLAHDYIENENLQLKWEEFNKEINLFYPSNADYFLEVSPNTVLGKCTESVEIECFTEKNLLTDNTVFEFESFSKSENINKLMDMGIISNSDFKIEKNYLTDKDVIRINNEKMNEIEKIVIHSYNSNYKNYKSKFLKKIKDSIGFTMLDDFYRKLININNIFSNKLTTELKEMFNFNTKEKVYYYNLIYFLEEMSIKQNEVVKKMQG